MGTPGHNPLPDKPQGRRTVARTRQERAYYRALRQQWQAAHPGETYVTEGPFTHGTRCTYTLYSCRCPPCTAAEQARDRRRQPLRRSTLPDNSQFLAACQFLDERHPQGWTAAQVAEAMEIQPRQVPPRLRHLADAGYIYRHRQTQAEVLWRVAAFHRR